MNVVTLMKKDNFNSMNCGILKAIRDFKDNHPEIDNEQIINGLVSKEEIEEELEMFNALMRDTKAVG